MDDWDAQLKEQSVRGFDRYKILRLDLATAHNDQRVCLAGDFIFVEKVSSATANATIKLNRLINDAINLRLHTTIQTIFTDFYLSNDAQPGEWIELVIGCQFSISRADPVKPAESQPAITITCTLANTNYVGPNAIAEIVLIKNDVENAGIIWVDFNNAAVQGACLSLDPGEWSRHRLSNLNLINANAEIATEILIAIREV